MELQQSPKSVCNLCLFKLSFQEVLVCAYVLAVSLATHESNQVLVQPTKPLSCLVVHQRPTEGQAMCSPVSRGFLRHREVVPLLSGGLPPTRPRVSSLWGFVFRFDCRLLSLGRESCVLFAELPRKTCGFLLVNLLSISCEMHRQGEGA